MKRKLIVVDTETGGLDASKHSLLSLAAVVYNDGAIEDEFYALVNEGNIIANDAALKVNGLTREQIEAEGKPVALVIGALHNMMDKHSLHSKVTLVAHNAPFDMAYMRRLYGLGGRKFEERFSYRALCTQAGALLLDAAGKIELPGGSASLDNLVKLFGIPLDREGGHTALADAKACALVLKRMTEIIRG